MEAVYKPVIAKAEFIGHTFDEIRLARGIEQSIQRFGEILRGEKKGRKAMEFIDKMIIESEELRKNDSE